MNEEGKKQNSKWNKNDWLWLTGFLFYNIILLMTVRFSQDTNLVNLISFAANGISISLGLIAIIISLIQNKDSRELNRNMSLTLERTQVKLEELDNKIDGIDVEQIISKMTKLEEITIQSLNSFTENINNKLEQKLTKETAKQVKDIIENELKQNSYNINQKIKHINEEINDNLSEILAKSANVNRTKARQLISNHLKHTNEFSKFEKNIFDKCINKYIDKLNNIENDSEGRS